MSGPGAGKTRGGKKKMIHHKGGNRRFTDFEELKAQAVEIKNMKNRDEDSDEEGTGAAGPAAAPPKKLPIAKKREDSSSDEESSDDGDEDDSDSDKHKGVEHLIEVENPNRVKQKMKKVTDLKLENTELSRKEKEAIEKERKKQEYQRLHALGKTDEAQADLARLQIIRKQREEAAKKREEEKLAKEKAGKEQQTSKLAGGVANMKL